MYESLIKYFENKTVLILGFGKEGQSTYNFLRRFYPEKKLAIADKRDLNLVDENIIYHTGEQYLEAINDYDIVMQSPGISLRDVIINNNTEITGQMDLFLQYAF